jgi:hypothetical protein
MDGLPTDGHGVYGAGENTEGRKNGGGESVEGGGHDYGEGVDGYYEADDESVDGSGEVFVKVEHDKRSGR